MVLINDNKIHFHFLTTPFFFPDRTKLKSFIRDLLKREGREIENINYIFCTDEYLLELNKTHLNHDTLTDIITFELSETGEALVSDVYISTERVRENAKTYLTSFKSELHRVILHGALHLCGYKDKTMEQTEQMRAKENQYLKAYFVPRETKR